MVGLSVLYAVPSFRRWSHCEFPILTDHLPYVTPQAFLYLLSATVEERGAIDHGLETHSYGADAPSEYEGRSSAGSLS